MTAGLVSSQFRASSRSEQFRGLADDDSNVRSDQKRTWRPTRSRNSRRRASQVIYAVENTHRGTYRLGLSINSRVICNVYWNTWVEGEVANLEKSCEEVFLRPTTSVNRGSGRSRAYLKSYSLYQARVFCALSPRR